MQEGAIKCVVWDLDNTLWDGILLEDEDIMLKDTIKDIIEEIDKRGIIQSVCSKNDYASAQEHLRDFGLAEYFIYPQISWEPKSIAIKRLRDYLCIGMDTIMLVDDQPFEREEVKDAYPEVNCFDAQYYQQLLSLACLQSQFVTEETGMRRQMYQAQARREMDEQQYVDTPEKFLRSLHLKFVIGPAKEEDLARVEELTVRTNQLNATGITYSYEELDIFRQSDQHHLLVCELTDKYGSYGKIGIVLIELQATCWVIRLLLISCRVISRGVGTILLSYIVQRCKREGKQLLAEFRETGRNRMMFVAYRFAGFKEIGSQGQNDDGVLLLMNNLKTIQPFPTHVEIVES